MSTSSILGGLLAGIGQSRVDLQQKQMAEEKERRTNLFGLLTQMLPKFDPQTQQEISSFLLQGTMDPTTVKTKDVEKRVVDWFGRKRPSPKAEAERRKTLTPPPGTGGVPLPSHVLKPIPQIGPFQFEEERQTLQGMEAYQEQQRIEKGTAAQFREPPMPYQATQMGVLNRMTGQLSPLPAMPETTVDLRAIAKELGAPNPEAFAAVPEKHANAVIGAVGAGDRSRASAELRMETLRQQLQFQGEQREADRQLRLRIAETQKQMTPATQAERSALNYYLRVQSADEVAKTIETEIASQGIVGETWRKYAPNWLQTPLAQVFNQAVSQFAQGLLRKESGATINRDEYEMTARTYFPQPGDSKEVLLRKANARATILKGLKMEAGRAYAGEFGESGAGTPPPPPPGGGGVAYKFYAVNPQTGQRVGSNDGVTWVPVQ